MATRTVVTFGEAEKGELRIPYFFHSLAQLAEALGNPPEESQGLHYAIQALLFKQGLLFFRVEEEGFSTKDYLAGLKHLAKTESATPINAICLPGVGDSEIIDYAHQVCHLHKSLLIMNEKDLYDYLTSLKT